MVDDRLRQMRAARGLSLALVLALTPLPLSGQESIAVPSLIGPDTPKAISDEDVQGLADLLRLVVLQNLPHNFENTKEWGMTKEVWAGVDIKQEGLRLSTHSHRKVVNHGSWKRYQVNLVHPEQELQVRLENVRAVEGKGAGLTLIVDAHLLASGRWAEWRQGVQLFSFSADADAKVRLRVDCLVGIEFRIADSTPRLCLSPRVTDAGIELTDFRLQRISKLDGPGVHKFGHLLSDVLQEEIDQRRGKMVDRINGQIDKHRNVLTVSPADLMKQGLDQLWSRASELQAAASGSSG